jgi:hypothetical protein
MIIRNRPASFKYYRQKINLTVILLFVFNDPIEAFVTVINIFLRLHKSTYHPLPHAYQNILILMIFR